MSAAAVETAGFDSTRQDTRQRLIDVAVDLFTRYSFAGTSLQMIADELGFTKAAIYHHFRTREQLLDAVVGTDPRAAARHHRRRRDAARRRTPGPSTCSVGSPQLAVDNRVVAVLAADPAVAEMLRARREWDELIERQMALLADVEPGPGRTRQGGGRAGRHRRRLRVRRSSTSTATRCATHLVDAGRRALGLRTPRRNRRSVRLRNNSFSTDFSSPVRRGSSHVRRRACRSEGRTGDRRRFGYRQGDRRPPQCGRIPVAIFDLQASRGTALLRRRRHRPRADRRRAQEHPRRTRSGQRSWSTPPAWTASSRSSRSRSSSGSGSSTSTCTASST